MENCYQKDCNDTTNNQYHQHRENIYEIYEEICGARLTTNIGRIGGFERDFTKKTFEKIDKFLVEFEKGLFEFEELFNRNPIFRGRTVGVGAIDAATARACPSAVWRRRRARGSRGPPSFPPW